MTMMDRTAIQTGQFGSIPLWSYLFLFSEVIESCADGPCPAEPVRDSGDPRLQAEAAVRVALLKLSYDDGVDCRGRDHADLSGRRHGPRELPARHGDAHPALDDSGSRWCRDRMSVGRWRMHIGRAV